MPNDAFLKFMNTAHRGLLKVTGGKVGWSASGMPVLELTTTGRKSGQPRSVMLTSPHQLGDTLVVVASKGGEDTHPAWYLNLLDHPDVQVALQGRPAVPMRARVATGAERADLWPKLTGDHANYAGYQRKTDREIPVVLLEPVT